MVIGWRLLISHVHGALAFAKASGLLMIVCSLRRACNAFLRMVCVGLTKTLLPWRTATTTITTCRKKLAQEIYVDVELVLRAGNYEALAWSWRLLTF